MFRNSNLTETETLTSVFYTSQKKLEYDNDTMTRGISSIF